MADTYVLDFPEGNCWRINAHEIELLTGVNPVPDLHFSTAFPCGWDERDAKV